MSNAPNAVPEEERLIRVTVLTDDEPSPPIRVAPVVEGPVIESPDETLADCPAHRAVTAEGAGSAEAEQRPIRVTALVDEEPSPPGGQGK